ncbi:MAG: hypothetical protein ACERKV_06930 [Clostridiaceae bacterium]
MFYNFLFRFNSLSFLLISFSISSTFSINVFVSLLSNFLSASANKVILRNYEGVITTYHEIYN